MSIDYSTLKQILKDDEVIIDFFDYVTKSRGRVYVAYIIDKKHQHPVLKELFTEKDIAKINIPMPDMAYEHPYAEKILKLIWQPLFQYTKNKKTVYYIPSHSLFKIALEAMPCDSNTLLGEQYNIVRLSSAREFVRNNRKAPKTYKLKQAVLYGGIEYDMTEEEMYVEAQKYNRNEYYAMHRSIARGDTIYRPLPETEREINEIETILKRAAYDVQPFSGTHGTEETFISMSGNAPKILHIATHGFYYTPQDAKDIDFLNGYSDAMLLSGLVLAGGNRAWMGKALPKQTMDGILTADNIAQLDLEETELVVLSACQTAQGKATAEGLYGLQRAFKKAGVKTIVMSLWNVDDAVGKEFMVKFYENMTKHKKENDIRKAFRDTRKYIREKYSEPYYWAGFIMLD